MKLQYPRLFLKISGEALSGQHDGGIDTNLVTWIAKQVGEAVEAGVEVMIMVGGGNYARGAQLAGNGVGRVTADNVGMLATMMNGLVVADVFNAVGVPTRVLSNIQANQVVDDFTQRRAESHLKKKRVVIIAGGIGRPYLTTDTAAVNLALEMDCNLVCKATKVDGVYDKDPHKHKDAKRFERLSFAEAVDNPNIQVMDKAAFALAMEHHKPVLVFDLKADGNIKKAALGEQIGTYVS